MTFTLAAVGGEVVPVAPGAVVGLAAAARDGAARLTWSPPTTSGSAPVTGYVITATADGMTRRYSAPAGTTALDLGQLINGLAWTVSVVASTSVGPGPAAAATVTPSAGAGAPESPVNPTPTPAGAPTLLTLNAGADGAVATWSAPVDNGGSPITSYHFVAVSSDGLVRGVYAPAMAPLVATLYPLTNDLVHTVTVAAVTGFGEGASSNALTVQPSASGPDIGPPATDPGTVYTPPPQPALAAFPVTYPLAPAFFLASADEAARILASSSPSAVTP